MIFVINGLKYDTDKLKLISDKCEHKYHSSYFHNTVYTVAAKLYKSEKNNWLLTYEKPGKYCAKALVEDEAAKLLLLYDLEAYEEIFGELEEA